MNIGSGHHEISGDEIKKGKREDFSKPNDQCHQRDKYLEFPPSRILGAILKVDEKRTSAKNQRTRKLMIYKALHPREDIDRLTVLRKKGGRRLANI